MNDKKNRNEVVTITINGVEQQVEVRVRYSFDERWGKKPRVFVEVADEGLVENLENRRNRPVKVYSKIVRAALAEANIGIEKLLWSQYAGCTCACSPGFILTTTGAKIGYRQHDEYAQCSIWVVIKKQPLVQNDGYITPLENYGFGEFGRSVSAEEVVKEDTAVMC